MTAWTDFVKQYAKENNLSYKESLKQAAPSFKQQKEKPCPKGHTICSCSAEPPTPPEVAPPTKKYKKVKLNIIEDEEPTPEVVPKKLKKKKLKMPSPYRKVKLNIIEDDADADAIELPKIEPPPTQTRELTETIETTNEPIKQKKKKPRKVKLDIQESPYQNIIDEWDTVTLPHILFQEQPKIYDAIEKKILTLAKKKSSVVIPDLLFFIKPFLDDLFVHYGSNKTALDIIQKGMADLVISMGYDEDKVFKDNTEYLGKHFNKKHKKIIYDIFK